MTKLQSIRLSESLKLIQNITMNSSSKKLSLLASNPNLKRDRLSFLSTQDSFRPSTIFTTQPTRQSVDSSPFISPLNTEKPSDSRLMQNYSTVQHRLSSKKKKQPVGQTSTYPGTRDRLSSYLAYDDQYSRCRARMKQDPSYYHLSQNLFAFGEMPIPDEVIEEYTKAKTNAYDPTKMVVCRGYLPEIAQAYYTIDNVVFFVNMAPCFRLGKAGEPMRVEVGKPVIKIMEGRLRRSMLKSRGQRVLVLVHSEAVSFCLANLDDMGKLYFEDLHLNLSLPGEIITQVAFSESGDLFFIDRFGELNIISDKPSKRLFLFKTGYQQLYTKNRQPSAICQFIKKYKQQGFNQSLKCVSKSFSERWNRFLSSRIICRSLFVDNPRKIIVALIVKVYSSGLQDATITVFKLHDNSKASMVHSVNQVELFRILSGFGLMLNPNCFGIHRLCAVEESYFPDCNAEIILSTGTRIYVQITRDFVKPLKTIYPPNIQEGYLTGTRMASKSSIIVKSQRVEMSANSPIQLIDCSLKRQLYLQFYKMSSRITTCLSSRLNSYDRPIIGQVSWHSFGAPGTSYPQQLFSYPIPQSCFFPPKLSQLLCTSPPTRYQLSCPQLHQLARQTYLPPDFFLMMSQRDLQLIGKLRPVDIVMLWLVKLSIEDCQAKFEAAVKAWKRVEVLAMLLMVICDRQAAYYTTTELVRGLDAEVSRRRSKVEAVDINLRSQPRLLMASESDKAVMQKAHRLFNQLGEINQPIKEDDDVLDVYSVLRREELKIQPCSTKEQALCLYLGRVLRPVWWREAKELTQDETKIVSDKLGYIYDFISNNPINSLDALLTKPKQGPRPVCLQDQLQTFTLRCIQLLCFLRTVYWIPQGQFQQLSAQQNSYFQAYLFNELHKQDQTVIAYWSAEFSKLVDEKFFKIARLYFRIREIRNQKEVIKMCEDFGELPSYFIDDLKKSRNIMTETLRRHIGSKETKQDLLRDGNPEQRYEAAIELISSSSFIQEKIRYTQTAIDCAKTILDNRSISRQTQYTYQTQLSQLFRKRRLFYIQKALIDAMMTRGSSNASSIISLLNSNEFDPNSLKQSVLKSADDTAILLWYLNFPPANSSEYNISVELDRLINSRQERWPKALEQTLRYVFGLIDQTTKQTFLPTIVSKVQPFNLQVYQHQFQNIISAPTINFKNRNPYWFSPILLAEGFSLTDMIKTYCSKTNEAVSRIQTEDYSQQLMNMFYYWLFALHHLVSFVGLKEHQTTARIVFEECLHRMVQIDRVAPDRAVELRRVLGKFKDAYD